MVTALEEYKRHMATRKLAEATVTKRLDLLRRLGTFIAPTELLDATPEQLERFQQSFADKARSSVDIYTRHAKAFYRWAVETDRIATDPTRRMVRVRPKRGVPHPISEEDLRMVLACSRGGLRLAYVLAAFAGLRSGEITRLRGEDLTLNAAQPTALIHGKGDVERVVPLLPPVVAELRTNIGQNIRRGVLVRRADGRPYTPSVLTVTSCRFMRTVGVDSTLHSMRHYFATEVVKLTKDILLVRDLLGHSSIATTQIYLKSTIDGAGERLAAFSLGAGTLLSNNN